MGAVVSTCMQGRIHLRFDVALRHALGQQLGHIQRAKVVEDHRAALEVVTKDLHRMWTHRVLQRRLGRWICQLERARAEELMDPLFFAPARRCRKGYRGLGHVALVLFQIARAAVGGGRLGAELGACPAELFEALLLWGPRAILGRRVRRRHEPARIPPEPARLPADPLEAQSIARGGRELVLNVPPDAGRASPIPPASTSVYTPPSTL